MPVPVTINTTVHQLRKGDRITAFGQWFNCEGVTIRAENDKVLTVEGNDTPRLRKFRDHHRSLSVSNESGELSNRIELSNRPVTIVRVVATYNDEAAGALARLVSVATREMADADNWNALDALGVLAPEGDATTPDSLLHTAGWKISSVLAEAERVALWRAVRRGIDGRREHQPDADPTTILVDAITDVVRDARRVVEELPDQGNESRVFTARCQWLGAADFLARLVPFSYHPGGLLHDYLTAAADAERFGDTPVTST